MPLAVSATTFERPQRVDVDERVHVGGEVGEHVALADRARRAATGGQAGDAASALMSSRPLSSPTGLAPARQSLMPLYAAGLCDAVSCAAGRVEVAGGEEDLVGRAQAELDDVDALGR